MNAGFVFIAPKGASLPDRTMKPRTTRRTPTGKGRDKRRRMATLFNPHRYIPFGWVRLGMVESVDLDLS